MQPLEKYMIYKQRVCDGQMSVTPQFWMICIDLMEKQHHFHTAAQEGTFGGRMCAWEFFLPFFFSTNKYNHARHGSWYKHQIRKRDSLHSGDEIIFSVQSQARYNLQTAVEQRGEQSLNKGAKLWAVLEDSLLKMMQSLTGPWEGLSKPEIWIPCCKCATLGNSTMCTTAHGLYKFWSQNRASQMLLHFWRMSLPTCSILH